MCQTATTTGHLPEMHQSRVKPPLWEYATRSYNYVFFCIFPVLGFFLTLSCALIASNLTYQLVWSLGSSSQQPTAALVSAVHWPDTRLLMVLSLLYTPVLWLASCRLRRRPVQSPEPISADHNIPSTPNDGALDVGFPPGSAPSRTDLEPIENMFKNSLITESMRIQSEEREEICLGWSDGLSHWAFTRVWQQSGILLHFTLHCAFVVTKCTADWISFFLLARRTIYTFCVFCKKIIMTAIGEIAHTLWKYTGIFGRFSWSQAQEWTPFGPYWDYEGHGSPTQYSNLKLYNHKWAFYSILPLKKFSRWWGQFNQLRLPVFMRSPAFRLYCFLFDCKLYEADVRNLRHYPNLCAFFQRRLRPGIRPIALHNVLTSPADGRILHLGPVTSEGLEQVKGVNYSLRGFLGPSTLPGLSSVDRRRYRAGGRPRLVPSNSYPTMTDGNYQKHLLVNRGTRLYQCIVYLAPGDYHHFHSPADWTVIARRHFPGELFSVRPDMAKWLQGLFNMNERVLCTGRWRHGFFAMTAVGATNVGSISMDFDETLKTNISNGYRRGSYSYHDVSYCDTEHHHSSCSRIHQPGPDCGVKLRRGEHMGAFNLGSTVVLLFEAPKSFHFLVEPGDKVNYGEGLGTFDL